MKPAMRLVSFALLAATPLFLSACLATFGPEDAAAERSRLARLQATQLSEARLRLAESQRLAALEAERQRALRRPRAARVLVDAMKTGVYHCDLARQVELVTVADNGLGATLRWMGTDYQMNAVQAATGALRLENLQAGLVWLTVIGKSILLDARDGKQLANDCTRRS